MAARDRDNPHIAPPRGSYGFGWMLPRTIRLPYRLPKPANSAAYWMAAENLVAAYQAGLIDGSGDDGAALNRELYENLVNRVAELEQPRNAA